MTIKVADFWEAKKKLENKRSLTDEEREALIFIIDRFATKEIPSLRSYEKYIEAKKLLEKNQMEKEGANYLYFYGTVQNFEKNYSTYASLA